MKVVIIDTGCANLSSVKYALDRLGYQATITDETNPILSADKVLLPGVGTAHSAMQNLKSKGLIDVIKVINQPVLGICLGMQILMEQSEEGNVPTLGLIEGTVSKINDYGLPLPHMGWNKVYPLAGHHLFRNIPDASYFYFVHSYALPLSPATIAEVNYGERFTAAVQKDNFFGVQFHPERSGEAGAQLLKNFLEM